MIGPRLLLMTNRKLHTCYRLVLISMTLDDVEQPLALCFKIHAFSDPTTKITMKIDPYYQRQRCNAMTVVSGNIRFVQIFVGVPWRWSVKRHSGNWKHLFSGLSDVFGTLGNETNDEMCGSGRWSAEYLGSAEGLQIFRRRRVAGATSSEP